MRPAYRLWSSRDAKCSMFCAHTCSSMLPTANVKYWVWFRKNIRRSHTTLCTVHVCAKRCVFMSNIFKNRTLKKNKNLQRKYCSSSESVVWLRRHYYCVHSVHPCTCIVYSIKATTVVTLLRFQTFINYWPSFFRSGPVFRHHCKQLCNRILCHTVLRLSFLFGVLGFFKQLLVHLSVVHVWQ